VPEATGTARPDAGPRRLAASAATRIPYGRALGLITAIGAVLRFAFIARQPIGYDEDFSAVVLHAPVGRMIDIVSRDSAPPLYYLLERTVVAVTDMFGLASFGGPSGPVALRLVPVLAGIALIPLLAALAKRVGGDAASLWTALFVALAPTTLMLSGFARMYGLAAALTVASALLLWRATERPSPARWAAYVAAGAAAVWTDYFAAVALAGIFAAALWLRPGRRSAAIALAATALAVASIAPWLVVARAQFEHASQGFWLPQLSPTMVAGTLAQLFIGPPVKAGLPFETVLIALQALAAIAGFAALAGAVLAWRRLDADGRRAAIFCLLASSGVALLAVVSLWRPLLDARYAGAIWLPLFALAGAGLASMPRRVAGLLVAAVAVPALALSVATTHAETSSLVPELDAEVGQQDMVGATWNHYLILLDEAGPGVQARLQVLSSDDPPWFVGTAAYPAGAVSHEVPADVIANRGRVFWIADPGVAPPSLPAGYHATASRCAILVCLTIYGPGEG
jgi:4-amino-4-deoxy-L-arabinose transferase-like glycosyltransferase